MQGWIQSRHVEHHPCTTQAPIKTRYVLNMTENQYSFKELVYLKYCKLEKRCFSINSIYHEHNAEGIYDINEIKLMATLILPPPPN